MRMINRSGQDIEYRVSGGGNARMAPAYDNGVPTATVEVNGWAVLAEGQELEISDNPAAGQTLEVRVGEKKPTAVILDAIDDMIEVGRNLKVKILKTTGSGNRR